MNNLMDFFFVLCNIVIMAEFHVAAHVTLSGAQLYVLHKSNKFQLKFLKKLICMSITPR